MLKVSRNGLVLIFRCNTFCNAFKHCHYFNFPASPFIRSIRFFLPIQLLLINELTFTLSVNNNHIPPFALPLHQHPFLLSHQREFNYLQHLSSNSRSSTLLINLSRATHIIDVLADFDGHTSFEQIIIHSH